MNLPDWAKDQIIVRVDVHFSWRDRLRILVWGRAEALVHTNTEHKPGRCESETTVGGWRPQWPWERNHGWISAPIDPPDFSVPLETGMRRTSRADTPLSVDLQKRLEAFDVARMRGRY